MGLLDISIVGSWLIVVYIWQQFVPLKQEDPNKPHPYKVMSSPWISTIMHIRQC